MFELLTSNYILNVAVLAWATAQILKTALNYLSTKKFNFERLVGSGGMPSSHSAFVSAMATATLKHCGFSSPQFAIAFGIAAIVMYDAMGVRRAAGDQARVLNELTDIFTGDERFIDSKKLKELVGHTPLEVIGGAITGILIATVF